MKAAIAIMIVLNLTSFASAENFNVSSLLKRDFGDSIDINSDKEIWYCPDNTCEIYTAREAHPDFPAYVYMHLFHQSSYTYLDLSLADVKSFRSAAVEEPEVREKLTKYCLSNTDEPNCILSGMEKQLVISVCFGRYDEGGFWGCDEHQERALTWHSRGTR